MPGETHPAYAGNRLVAEWVDEYGPFAGRNTLHLPVMPVLRLEYFNLDPRFDAPAPRRRTLTRRVAFGPAPYVGRPFVYQWNVAEDDLGRTVAARTTWLRYTEPEDAYMVRTGDVDGPWARLSRPTHDGRAYPVQTAP